MDSEVLRKTGEEYTSLVQQAEQYRLGFAGSDFLRAAGKASGTYHDITLTRQAGDLQGMSSILAARPVQYASGFTLGRSFRRGVLVLAEAVRMH